MTVRAVTVDFWNTLVREPPGLLARMRRDAVVAAVAQLGAAISTAEIDTALSAASEAHSRAWSNGRIHLPQDGARRFAEHLADGRLRADETARLARAFLSSSSGAALPIADGAAPALRELRDGGARLAIVCDVGLTPSPILRDVLDRAGLLALFDAWAFSDEVGQYKPAPQIFDHALRALGVAAADATHVGDLRRTDVAGARAIGMRSVRYRGIADDRTAVPDADHVIDDWRELPALVYAQIAVAARKSAV